MKNKNSNKNTSTRRKKKNYTVLATCIESNSKQIKKEKAVAN